MVDVQFARTFKHLLDRLAGTPGPNGALIDRGVACWYNDNANGPPHGANDVPWVLAGSCAGFLKTSSVRYRSCSLCMSTPQATGNSHDLFAFSSRSIA